MPVAAAPSQRAVFSISVWCLSRSPSRLPFPILPGLGVPSAAPAVLLSGLLPSPGSRDRAVLLVRWSSSLSRARACPSLDLMLWVPEGSRSCSRPHLCAPQLCSSFVQPVGHTLTYSQSPLRWCRSWSLPRQSWLLFSLRGEPSSLAACGRRVSGHGQAIPLQLLDSPVARGSLCPWLRAWHRIPAWELLAQ